MFETKLFQLIGDYVPVILYITLCNLGHIIYSFWPSIINCLKPYPPTL